VFLGIEHIHQQTFNSPPINVIIALNNNILNAVIQVHFVVLYPRFPGPAFTPLFRLPPDFRLRQPADEGHDRQHQP
jgi:hypothetical protein